MQEKLETRIKPLNTENKLAKFLKSSWMYIGAIIYVILVYIFINPLMIQNITFTRLLFLFAMIVVGILGVIYILIKLKKDEKFNYIKILIAILLIIGTLMRTNYITYTSYYTNQHDVGDLKMKGLNGHLEYILNIYDKGALPETNSYQLYHPPLHHITSAAFLKISNTLGVDFNRSIEGMQVLTLFYSILMMIVCYKILTELKIKGLPLLIAISILIFHPTFIILSGSINNDILMYLLMFVIILYLVKWYKKSNIKNTIILALATGLCVMTKISGALIALPIIIVFLVKFISAIKRKEIKKYLILFLIFGIISLPIGLWYPIRNYIKFEQPLNYVYEISKENELYCGNHSLVERFFTIPKQELQSPYAHALDDYSVPGYIIKSSMFGEYEIGKGQDIAAYSLLVVNILIIIASLISMIRVLILDKNKEHRLLKYSLALIWLVQIISYISFNISYPFGCTMDFRYIVATILTGAIFVALDIDNIKNIKIKKIYTCSLMLLIITFSFLSLYMYI